MPSRLLGDCLKAKKDEEENEDVQLEPKRARPTAAEEAAAGKGDKHGDTETAVEEDLTMHDAVRLTLAPYHRSHAQIRSTSTCLASADTPRINPGQPVRKKALNYLISQGIAKLSPRVPSLTPQTWPSAGALGLSHPSPVGCSRGHEPAKSRGGELWPAASPRGTLSHRAAQPKAAAQAPTSAAQRAPLSGARATALCTLAFSARLDVCTLSLTPLTRGRDLRFAFSHLLAPD